ncbi:MAG: hypothetical protein Q9195_008942 [Heterodermia aff. obscurata]
MSPFNLLALSTELILRIIDEVSPVDIESLALGNKVIRTLCQAALQRHHHLQEQYSTLSLGRGHIWPEGAATADDRSFEGLDPLLLLVRFLANPRLAYYPTKLEIGNCYVDDRSSQKIPRALDAICPTWESDLAALPTNSPWLAQMDVGLRQEWHYGLLNIQANSQMYYLGILLTMLPNLRSLLFFSMAYDDDDLEAVYSTLPIAEIINVIALVNRNQESSIYMKALGSLHTVTVVREEIAMFALFATLPSVHSLLGERIAGIIDTGCKLPNADQLEELDIKESSIDVDCFEWMLRSMTGLKRLGYNHDEGYVACGEPYDAVNLLRMIERHTAKSLERLELTVDEDNLWFEQIQQQLVSLRGFKVLRELKVDFEIFHWRGHDDEPVLDLDVGCKRLVDVLPASIRVLRLSKRYWPGNMRPLAAKIVREKAKKLPELQNIIFESSFACTGGRLDD